MLNESLTKLERVRLIVSDLMGWNTWDTCGICMEYRVFSSGSKSRPFYSTIGCSKMGLFEVLKFLEMMSINGDGSDVYFF